MNEEIAINGLHLACAFCGFALGLIVGAVMGYQWRKESEKENVKYGTLRV